MHFGFELSHLGSGRFAKEAQQFGIDLLCMGPNDAVRASFYDNQARPFDKFRGAISRRQKGISVVPGDHVDVLVAGKGQEITTVLENVEVAAAEKESGVVTFLVSPDDAQRVMDAGEQGEFRLRLWKSN